MSLFSYQVSLQGSVLKPYNYKSYGRESETLQSGPRYSRMMNRYHWKGFSPPTYFSIGGGEPLSLQRPDDFWHCRQWRQSGLRFFPQDEPRRGHSAQTSRKRLPRPFSERRSICQTFNRESRRPRPFIRLLYAPRLPTKPWTPHFGTNSSDFTLQPPHDVFLLRTRCFPSGFGNGAANWVCGGHGA